MADPQASRNLGRSVVAVLIGILVGVVLSLGTDALLRKAGIFPALGTLMSDSLFALATAYRTLYNVLSSYIIARLAPNRPMQHALIAGMLGVVVSAIGAVVTWNKPLGPHWYPVALVLLSMPCAWLGGWLRMRQIRMHAAA